MVPGQLDSKCNNCPAARLASLLVFDGYHMHASEYRKTTLEGCVKRNVVDRSGLGRVSTKKKFEPEKKCLVPCDWSPRLGPPQKLIQDNDQGSILLKLSKIILEQEQSGVTKAVSCRSVATECHTVRYERNSFTSPGRTKCRSSRSY